MRIELTPEPWQGSVLPLNYYYTRAQGTRRNTKPPSVAEFTAICELLNMSVHMGGCNGNAPLSSEPQSDVLLLN